MVSMIEDIFLFIDIAKYKNFTMVAKRNNIHPSTLLRKIRNLESELNCQLYRVGKKNQVEITEHGNRLYEIFVPITVSAQDAKKTFMSDKEIRGSITLVIPPMLQEILLVDQLLDLRKKHPQLIIDIRHSFYTEAGVAVNFDLAVSTIVPKVPGFIQQSILPLQLGFFATQEYIDNHRQFMSLDKIAQNEFIIYAFPDSQLIKKVVLTNTNDKIVEFVIDDFSYSCNSLRTAAILAEKSLGIAALPINYQSLSLKRIFPEYLVDFNLAVFLIQYNKSQDLKKLLVLETIKSILGKTTIFNM